MKNQHRSIDAGSIRMVSGDITDQKLLRAFVDMSNPPPNVHASSIREPHPAVFRAYGSPSEDIEPDQKAARAEDSQKAAAGEKPVPEKEIMLMLRGDIRNIIHDLRRTRKDQSLFQNSDFLEDFSLKVTGLLESVSPTPITVIMRKSEDGIPTFDFDIYNNALFYFKEAYREPKLLKVNRFVNDFVTRMNRLLFTEASPLRFLLSTGDADRLYQ